MGSRGAAACTVAFIAAGIVCGTATVAHASPRSRALVREGAAAMRAGDDATANTRFRAALKADPSDSDALVYLAALANREGDAPLALDFAQRARAMGNDHPDLDFELGWAQLDTGLLTAAIASLERYDAAHPGRGLTSELLGRAYMGLGAFDKARARLEEAMRRDPSLRANALYFLAQIEAVSGHDNDATATLRRLMREQPGSPLTRTLRDQLAAAAPAAEKPWSVSILTGIGYNNNIIAAGEGAPLPSDVTGRASPFGRAGLQAEYRPYTTDHVRIALRYAFLSDTYFRSSLSSYDVRDHTPEIEATVRVAPDLTAGMRFDLEYTELGGTDFRTATDGRPSLAYRVNDWIVVEGAYQYSHLRYGQAPVTPAQQRGGDLHSESVTAYLTPPNRYGIQGSVGYVHTRRDLDGSDFRGESDVIRVAATAPLPWQIGAALSYAHSFDRYDNVNTSPGTTGTIVRSDDVDLITLQFTRPVTDQVNVFARYDYVDDASNLAIYAYQQHVVTAGLIVNF